MTMTDLGDLIRMLGEIQGGMDRLGGQTTKLGELLVVAHASAQQVTNLCFQRGTRRYSLHLA